ncbi:MAG: DUF2470 domain-containing protein [Mariprofundus sp.]|nr:DUF2470 domain-containing protein [Mariprofundus sp.]
MAEKGKQHATGSTMSDIPRPTHGEGVKTLLHSQNIGTLSTHSSHHDGYPFGSMMPYALDADDNPLFLISTMAVHTQNILKNPKASLYVAAPNAEGEPLGAARLTLMGDVSRTENDDVRSIYLKAHANARHWVDFDDFSFYRLAIKQAYYVGGFGVMGWIDHEAYLASSPDPLRKIAADVIEHMNNDHADALILLAKHQGGIDADEVRMIGVDRLGFDVKVHIGEQLRSARISFPNSVDDAADVRSVFVAMVQQARKSQKT